jgi:hypothetical protein
MQQAAAAQESLREQLAQQEATIQEQLQQLEELNATIVDLQNQLGKQTAWHLNRNMSISNVTTASACYVSAPFLDLHH